MFASLGISAQLVKGNFLGMLGRMLLLGLIGMVIMMIPVIGWLVGPALMMVAWRLLYIELSGYEPAQAAEPEALTKATEAPEPLPEPEPEPVLAIASSTVPGQATVSTRGPIVAVATGLFYSLYRWRRV